MNYPISETEHRSLELLRDQFNLIAGLLAIADVELGTITSAGLYAFMDERRRDLDRILEAVSERQSAQRAQENEQGILHFADLLFALRIARGDILHTPNGAEQRITEKLTKAAKIDSDVKGALDEWLVTLEHVGVQRTAVGCSASSVAKRSVQRRTRKPGATPR